MQPRNQHQHQEQLPMFYQPTSLLEKRPKVSFDENALTLQDTTLLHNLPKKMKLKPSYSVEAIISTEVPSNVSEYSVETEIPYLKHASAPEIPIKIEPSYEDVASFLEINPKVCNEDLTMVPPVQNYLTTRFPQVAFEMKLNQEQDCIVLGRVKPAKIKQQDSLDNLSPQSHSKRGRKKKDSFKELERRKYWQAIEAQELAAYFMKKNNVPGTPGNFSTPTDSFNFGFPAINNDNYLYQHTGNLLQYSQIAKPVQYNQCDSNIYCKYEPSASTTHSQKESLKQEEMFAKNEEDSLSTSFIPWTKEEAPE